MDSKRLQPYGLRTLLECLGRLSVLSQPDDTMKFSFEYVTTLVKDPNCEQDIRELIFQNEEEWGKFMLLFTTQVHTHVQVQTSWRNSNNS